MLFDLRGRGRRRTVRVVYSGLALLFLLGFVGFGVGSIGGGGGGGVVEALFGNKEGGGGTNYESQVKAAKKLTVQQPQNSAAWGQLIHAVLLQAGGGENYNSTENSFTSKAQPLLRQIHEAWQHYLKLNPQHPSSELAAEVLRVYTTPGGLNEPAEAMKALKIEIANRPPSASLYYDLAVLAYQANDKSEGDRASKKALALAPASEKATLKTYLAKAKAGNSTTGASGGGTVITTKNGQTVTIPSSDLKGATQGSGGKTVTIPSSALPKGVATAPASTSASATTTAPASTTAPAGGKKK
jgi:tetratricopeptide (TPR) repeat protein